MDDQRYMQLALDLAAQAKGKTNPNPLVGAVIVKEGRIIGFGAHLKAGEPHAEVHAFRVADDQAEGATLYVTLEPCAHHGRTPPCADLVVRSRVKRVVVAMEDPNPLVAGRGVARLREAGIEVEVGVLEEQAKCLNERFVYNITMSLPYVVLKIAMTLDGKIGTHTKDSRWITGPEARMAVHRLRNEVDGILVGIGTVLADDPELTTRMPEGEGKNPIRILLDTKLRIPETAKVLDTTVAPTWIVTGQNIDPLKRERLEARGVEVISVTHATNGVQIEPLLQLLYQMGISHLLVEGGAMVNSSFLESKLVNQIICYIAPKLVGGAGAPTLFAGKGVAKMADAYEFRSSSWELVGDDLCFTGILK